jgi:hypothetical protein
MKKVLLFILAVGIGIGATAQFKPFHGKQSSIKLPRPTCKFDGTEIGVSNPNVIVSNKAMLDDPIVIETRYDLQSNNNSPRHLYLHPDQTIGAVATMSHEDAFTDRGTGYNYYDGTDWGLPPAARIEGTIRTGWPNYAPLGPGGECVVAHQSGTLPIVFSKRDTKGTGAWTTNTIASPTGSPGMLWPRMITNGTDNMNVHIICLTAPTGNGGVIYNNMNGAILYIRSTDGGNTWGPWQQLAGMTSTEYMAFTADVYEWANPVGNNIAFTYSDSWFDFAVMKSTNNGDTWTKTVIWPCPYNFWAGGDTTGMFWCPDGFVYAAMDNNAKVHVAAGLQRANGDDAGAKYWYPFTDGLLYWNEDMPTWPDVLDTAWLNANGYIVGWLQDTMVWYQQGSELAYYYSSLSSFPTMLIDQANHVYVIWAGVTTYKDANSFMYRHLYARAKVDGVWRENILDLTGDFIYQFMECVYPTASPTCKIDKIEVTFQGDDEAGVYLKGSQGAQGQLGITDNDIIFLEPLKNDIIAPGTGMKENNKVDFIVNQNVPNPVLDQTKVKVVLSKAGNLSLQLFSAVGQQVMEINKGLVNAGNNYINIDASNLPAGVYFYTVKVDNGSVTKKMIVE